MAIKKSPGKSPKKTATSKKASGKKAPAKKIPAKKAGAKKKTGAGKAAAAGKAIARRKTAKKAGAEEATSARTPEATGPEERKSKSRVSSLNVNLGHVFSLRPRVSTSFRQEDFLTARRLLQEEAYSSIQEAARAVAERALELTHEGPSRRSFGRGL